MFKNLHFRYMMASLVKQDNIVGQVTDDGGDDNIPESPSNSRALTFRLSIASDAKESEET